MNKSKSKWHTFEIGEVVDRLSTNITDGLSSDKVAGLKKVFGSNYFEERIHLTFVRKLWRYFKSPLNLILVLALIVTLFLNKNADATVIGIAIKQVSFFTQINKSGFINRPHTPTQFYNIS